MRNSDKIRYKNMEYQPKRNLGLKQSWHRCKKEIQGEEESVGLIKENLVLVKKAGKRKEKIELEKQVSNNLQAELDQPYKKIKMPTETKELIRF